MLNITLFGNFHIVHNGQEIDLMGRDRFKILLAYLILHRDTPQARRYIAMRFWPESHEHQALTNLRKLLVDLRKSYPDLDNFISITNGSLSWQSGVQYTFDVVEFENAIERAERTADEAVAQSELLYAVNLYKGDLMPHLYDDWILAERDRLRNAMIGALERLIRLYEQQHNYPAAISHLLHLARLDPLREETYRWLMQVQSHSGDRDGIVRTYRVCKELLARELDIEPSQPTRRLYEQLLQKDNDAASAHQATVATISTPLVNRKKEWAQLEAAWQRALQHKPYCVLISGEAGIGKTRLMEELQAMVTRHGYRAVYARAHELNREFTFAPIVDWLRTSWLFAKVRGLNQIWRNELARLLPELLGEQPENSNTKHLSEGSQRSPQRSPQRSYVYEALVHAFLDGDKPLLLLLDDLQWCDKETLEWLHFLIQANPRAQLLVVTALRFEDVPEEHPVIRWKLALQREDLLSEIILNPFNREDTAVLGEVIAGTMLSAPARMQLYQQTEGHPLFIVESMRAQSSHSNQVPLQPLASSTVHALFELRVMQLSRLGRSVAGLAATAGRTFTTSLLVQASGRDEELIVSALDELLRRRIIRERGPDIYDFSHEKLREISYAALSPATQRFNLRRISLVLESGSASTPAESDPLGSQHGVVDTVEEE